MLTINKGIQQSAVKVGHQYYLAEIHSYLIQSFASSLRYFVK